MAKANFNIDNVDWEGALVQLTAFAHYLTSTYTWFRGEDTAVFIGGQEAADYATEAIVRFMEAPEKFDPQKGDLLTYLKYNIVRTLIGNDARKKENSKTDDIWERDDEEEESTTPYSERLLPCIEASFPDDIDYETITTYVQSEIEGDKELEDVFLCTYLEGMKRTDAIEYLNMSDNKYDNAHRRLKTVFKKAAKHFTQTKPA